jgi:Leucine-rich repeat (LRR) protein
MRNLMDLTVSHAGPRAFDRLDLSGLTRLRILDISGNEIVIPPILPAQLTHLNVSRNCIEDISCFSALHQLQQLDVSYNRIKKLSVNIMQVLLNLENIDLTGNMLLVGGIFTIVRE